MVEKNKSQSQKLNLPIDGRLNRRVDVYFGSPALTENFAKQVLIGNPPACLTGRAYNIVTFIITQSIGFISLP